jgi:hypothetical protein
VANVVQPIQDVSEIGGHELLKLPLDLNEETPYRHGPYGALFSRYDY